jgi:ATP-dependent 26S proteasome regulatory subunit
LAELSGTTPDPFPLVMESPKGMILFTAPATGTKKMLKRNIKNIKEFVWILIFLPCF